MDELDINREDDPRAADARRIYESLRGVCEMCQRKGIPPETAASLFVKAAVESITAAGLDRDAGLKALIEMARRYFEHEPYDH